MYLDKNLEFGSAQAITASADSTNVIDFGLSGATGATLASIGVGREMAAGAGPVTLKVVCFVTTAFATLTSLQVQVKTAPDNGSGAEGTYTVAAESVAIPVANLTAGAKLELYFPFKSLSASALFPRFVKLSYVVAGSNATAGNITAELTAGEIDEANTVGYPSGFVVLN